MERQAIRHGTAAEDTLLIARFAMSVHPAQARLFASAHIN
jgi:hypothetical protein